jgi:excisionase family DNA binding protein
MSGISEMSRYRVLSIASVLQGRHCVMTADELAKFLKMSRITILRRAKRGLIPSFRVGSCVRFDSGAISKWLREQGVKSLSK